MRQCQWCGDYDWAWIVEKFDSGEKVLLCEGCYESESIQDLVDVFGLDVDTAQMEVNER